MTAPRWLDDEPWLRQLLHALLDGLEKPRTRDVTRRIKRSTTPALFAFGEDTEYRWQLIERLADDHGLFEIRYDRRLAPHQERYDNAQLRLRADAEPLLREWLERPRINPVDAGWHTAVGNHSGIFQDGGAALLDTKPALPDRSPEEMVAAFANLPTLLGQDLTLRELSARAFHGDSKFLDHRADLLARLFGGHADTIPARPLLLTAWAPAAFQQLLIVENQDSFLRLVEHPPADTALLYSGGFRASAARLNSEHTRFAYLPGSDAGYFQRHWLAPNHAASFWGDLDYAGLGILAALRQSLPHLRAWQPGYRPMLEALLNGDGHTPEQARKQGQTDPGQTGCDYTDQQLLPALRVHGRFLDQEGFQSE
ncbi:hypothetical protein ASALC70_00726 [Alcanivorax sp. ALC70]|nr:hypothetical protein ASALC70_00726 [Alcanivorax sp. ALC70]